MMAVGVFLALGAFNPLVGRLLLLPGFNLLRLPVKVWLLVAVGAALLCGLGFERLLAQHSPRPPLGRILAALATLYLSGWLVLTLLPGDSARWLRRWVPQTFGDEFVDHERVRWAGLCLISLLILATFGVIWRLGRRRLALAGAALVTVHLSGQLLLLHPVLARDELEPYLQPPALLQAVDAGATVVHGSAGGLFGRVPLRPEAFPDLRLQWLQRQIFADLYPVAGILWGRRYDFSQSAEGLDGFLTRATAQSMPQLSDVQRVRLLAASGVDYLLLGRELNHEALPEVELVERAKSAAGELLVYRLLQRAPHLQFVGKVLRAPHLNAALSWLTAADFDPTTTAVLPPGGAELDGPRGRVDLLRQGPESLAVRVISEHPGVLVIQKAFLPLYRASADGREVPIVAANMHRLGIELPAGVHEVRLWIDRRPLLAAFVVSVLAMLGLVVLVRRLARPTGSTGS
jgi:hypothetical protein